ncbi:MAG: SdrD B-like domain-containing protein, partial [Bacillota bacterium]
MKTFNKFTIIVLFLLSFSVITVKASSQNSCDLKGFVTYTQGGWGSPSNSQPGKIRDQYFSSVFPSGLVIGGNKTLTLTCASAVQSFLPQGKTASFFTKDYYNATSTSAGVFAGQMVALAMNIAYDKAGKTGTNSVDLEDLIFSSGIFAGKSVADFFIIANKAIGGASTGYSFADLSDVATKINENFDNGTVDKGYLTCPAAPASIGDKVWNDVNKNGIQDNGETGVSGVTVELYGANNLLKATTTTNSSGIYSFTNLAPGSYSLKFILPSGYVFSPKNAGSNDALDSDVDAATGKTEVTTLASGENDLSWDAGIYNQALDKASLGDRVWNDINHNGLQDQGEAGIAGVTVKLYSSQNNLLETKVTDSNGNYLFDNLTPGSYYVVFTPLTNYLFSAKDQGTSDAVDSDADQTTGKSQTVTLTAGYSNLTVDAGMYLFVPEKSSVGDKVWHDVNGNGIQDAGETGI